MLVKYFALDSKQQYPGRQAFLLAQVPDGFSQVIPLSDDTLTYRYYPGKGLDSAAATMYISDDTQFLHPIFVGFESEEPIDSSTGGVDGIFAINTASSFGPGKSCSKQLITVLIRLLSIPQATWKFSIKYEKFGNVDIYTKRALLLVTIVRSKTVAIMIPLYLFSFKKAFVLYFRLLLGRKKMDIWYLDIEAAYFKANVDRDLYLKVSDGVKTKKQ
ncbi:uncharacterized protein SAPINGB_P004875 [Magnusiomyces paraingens]|uniref:Uncharacterized protein n=1 Tax=Magnusiomyces paraingens TaxID=2606893 RepID=A0A5E8BZX9_9ASCO|nr:uncharacterized protein SAPINGB_P004875 [Saprochaete ingens]VVT56170.1 unnamed protein product [Saprochaete ingens]